MARVDMFDVAGRRVRTVGNRNFEARSHDLEWNGPDGAGQTASSGISLYPLRAGDFVQMKRMVLLKCGYLCVPFG